MRAREAAWVAAGAVNDAILQQRRGLQSLYVNPARPESKLTQTSKFRHVSLLGIISGTRRLAPCVASLLCHLGDI